MLYATVRIPGAEGVETERLLEVEPSVICATHVVAEPETAGQSPLVFRVVSAKGEDVALELDAEYANTPLTVNDLVMELDAAKASFTD